MVDTKSARELSVRFSSKRPSARSSPGGKVSKAKPRVGSIPQNPMTIVMESKCVLFQTLVRGREARINGSARVRVQLSTPTTSSLKAYKFCVALSLVKRAMEEAAGRPRSPACGWIVAKSSDFKSPPAGGSQSGMSPRSTRNIDRGEPVCLIRSR